MTDVKFIYNYGGPISVGDQVQNGCTGTGGGEKGEVVGLGRTRVKVRVASWPEGEDTFTVEPSCLRHLDPDPETVEKYEKERLARLRELLPPVDGTAAAQAAADTEALRAVAQVQGGGLVVEAATIKLIGAAGGGSIKVSMNGLMVALSNPVSIILDGTNNDGGVYEIRSIYLSPFERNTAHGEGIQISFDKVKGIAL